MTNKNDSSIKTSSINEVLGYFEQSLGRKLTKEDFGILRLDKEDPTPLSGEFSFKLSSVEGLKNIIQDTNKDAQIVSHNEETIVSAQKKKMR